MLTPAQEQVVDAILSRFGGGEFYPRGVVIEVITLSDARWLVEPNGDVVDERGERVPFAEAVRYGTSTHVE